MSHADNLRLKTLCFKCSKMLRWRREQQSTAAAPLSSHRDPLPPRKLPCSSAPSPLPPNFSGRYFGKWRVLKIPFWFCSFYYFQVKKKRNDPALTKSPWKLWRHKSWPANATLSFRLLNNHLQGSEVLWDRELKGTKSDSSLLRLWDEVLRLSHQILCPLAPGLKMPPR